MLTVQKLSLQLVSRTAPKQMLVQRVEATAQIASGYSQAH